MNKHSLLAPLITLVAFANAAIAQVEPRMVGEWHSGDSNQSLSVQSNGRYQSKVNGSVVDSGKISGTNGNWKLQSDSGRTDQGTFSFISGKMLLHGGLSGSWSHSPQQSPQATTASAPPNLPHNSQTYSSTFGHGQNDELRGAVKAGEEASTSTPATSASATLFPQKAKKGFFSGAGNFAKAAASQWLNGPQNGSPAGAANVSHGPRGDYVSPYWKDVNPGGHINASDINRTGSGMPANQTTEHWEHVQWQNRPASPGWQTVPRGGYIPVMKDNKARRYWGH